MQDGAERLCMASPSVEFFVEAVKQTVIANKKLVPPPGKGALYIRPLLIGSGANLGVAPAPEYTFLIYASPVGDYHKVSFCVAAAGLKYCVPAKRLLRTEMVESCREAQV
ncbi:BnaCnng05130D [Brassica napus]|uniref:BnaCnng05130D protein n=1 Tax=Brassica napus TaxID=3708 RepID=A0A078GTF4_BRANA|nr:BnaCnng05130D [Brassica napus]